MNPTIEQIIARVSVATEVPANVITGPHRTDRITRARFIAMTEIRKHHPYLPLVKIGQMFRRDHSTVVHALRRYVILRDKDEQFAHMANTAVFQRSL